jgi:ubiquinone/menaquinone biosynthesis C-methylase UbiE
VRQLYEDIWEHLPPDLPPYAFARRRDFLLASVSPGDRVLDLGCGEGAFCAVAAAAGAEPVGADVAERALERARERHPAVRFALVPAHGPFPFADGEFDLVWASEVLEHVADTARWLSEVRRVLRAGGRLLVTTPHHGRLRALALALAGWERHFDPVGEHLRFYTARSLRALLEDFGFEAIRVRGAGGPPLLRHGLHAQATRRPGL